MNPEEGELRPQLRDRFALSTTVTGLEEIEDRVAVIERALERSESAEDASDGDGGHEGTHTDEPDPAERLGRARERLPTVELPDGFAADIAELCRDAGVDGHRGDIATARAARALAALDGRRTVVEPDVRRAAELALGHRLQSTPFEDAPDPEDVVDDHFEDGDDGDDAGDADGDVDGEPDERNEGGDDADDGDDGGGDEADRSDDEGDETDGEPDRHDDGEPNEHGEQNDDGHPGPTLGDEHDDGGKPEPTGAEGSDEHDDGADGTDDGDDDGEETEGTPLVPGEARAPAGEAAAPELSVPDAAAPEAGGGGRADAAPDPDGKGPRVRTERAETGDRLDAAASVRAAASRGADAVASRDLRRSVRAGDAETLVLFVVDASASMRSAMRAAKGTVLELLQDAYEARDAVGFVAFAGEESEVLLPPTDSVTLAARHLKELPTGDRTPLPAGLRTARTVLDRADPAASVVLLVTDGRANVGECPTADTRAAAERLAERDPSVVVVDAGEDSRGSLVDVVLDATDGRRVPLDALSAARIDAAARES